MKPSSPLFPTAAAILVLAGAGCRSSRAADSPQALPEWPSVVLAEMGTMHTVFLMEGLWFGSEPGIEDLELARRRGVERVIDLRGTDPDDLARAGEQMGMRWTAIPFGASRGLDDEAVNRVLTLLGQESSPRTLMFCEDGSTCAALFAIHRILEFGLPLADALAEARRAGMHPGEGEEQVRAQIERITGGFLGSY